VILCDTGPIVAAALGDDDRHHECVELFTGLHLARRRLLVPGTVVAEVGYLLARNAGARVESLFLQALADGDFEPVDLQPRDYRRAAELVQMYADLPLGTTDATVIALADAGTAGSDDGRPRIAPRLRQITAEHSYSS
jgi:predicted nucleic acid-binding protein